MGCGKSKANAPVKDSVSKEEGVDAYLKSLFDKIDKNADGKLDANEVKKALEAESSLAELLEKGGYNPQYYVLEQLDANEDGKVAWEEFKKGLSASVSDRDAALSLLKSLFKNIDKNADEKLDKREIAKAMTSEPMLAKMLEKAGFQSQSKVLEQLDGNKDGTVSWDEFKACLEEAVAIQVAESEPSKEAPLAEEEPPKEAALKEAEVAEVETKIISNCFCF